MARQTQTINLDMKPQKNPPHIAVTEYDKGAGGWFLCLRLFQDGEPFIPDSGTTVKIEGTTPGGTGFSANATLVSNKNMVTFTLTKDMTAYKGSAWCKLILTKDGSVSGASGFWLDCDRAGVEAETVIGADGFQEQINQAVADYIEDSGLIIDQTLSRQGAAADAKAVGDAIKNNLASKYDPTLYYAAGNYVVHDNKLYRARAEIVPEAWKEAHWIRVSLAERVFELENAQIGIDKTLTVSGSAADAKAVGDKVAELKSATSLHDDEIDNTVQTITFASDGSIQKIEHKRNNVVIRTDTFTFATNMITEVRTLNTGETLTIATNLTTLETTVTYAAA